ncbi:MAG: hypothetical protein ABEJ87_05895 [Candidatus Nanohalobium sp.]
MAGAFQSIINVMWDMGLNLFFPWLIILAVTYGILNQYEVISEEEGVNGAIAIGVAFLGVLGISGSAGMFTTFAAAITFGVFGVLGLIVIMAASGYDITEHAEDSTSGFAVAAGLIAIISFLTVLFNFVDLSNWLPTTGNAFKQVIMPVLILIFLLAVIYMTMSTGD